LEEPVNILLVDDKVENLVALESILESPRYNLVRAQSGDEALMALLGDEFGAIVLDVKMPDMNGIELAQMIRARKKTQHVPILFLTAHASDSAAAGYEAGAVDFMSKPIQSAVLRSKVAVFADMHRSRRALAESNRALAAEVLEHRQAQERILNLNEELSRRVTDLGIANAELESFGYTVSHDLRAPLRQIAGFVRLLRDSLSHRLDAKSAEHFQLIERAVERMGQLIDDLLAFSRLGRMELQRENVDLEQLVDEVRGLLEANTNGRRIEWIIGTLPKVAADGAMLRQVLVNLLDNAMKFTRDRSPAVIEVGCSTGPTDHRFFVRDNGVGFDPAFTNKLFGVFQRLHSAKEYEGTGIGLAIVQRIVLRHGGRTWIESSPGQGTQISFTLPVASGIGS
jgi:signal transduction histidine kinase